MPLAEGVLVFERAELVAEHEPRGGAHALDDQDPVEVVRLVLVAAGFEALGGEPDGAGFFVMPDKSWPGIQVGCCWRQEIIVRVANFQGN